MMALGGSLEAFLNLAPQPQAPPAPSVPRHRIGVASAASAGGHAASGLAPTAFAGAVALCVLVAPAVRRRRRGTLRSLAALADSATEVKRALAQKEAEYRKRQTSERTASSVEIPTLASLEKRAFIGADELLQVPETEPGVRASVYAIFSPDGELQHIGISRSSKTSLRAHFARRPQLCGEFAIFDVRKPDRSLLEAARSAWLQENGASPAGNDGGAEQALWEAPIDVRAGLAQEEREALMSLMPEEATAKLRDFVLRAEAAQVEAFEALGCHEQLLFDAKLKAKGFLDLDAAAPAGIRRPEGGIGAAFKVVLKMASGEEAEIECPPDLTILDAAEQAGVELPSSCKSGACSACAGRVTGGIVDQSDQSYLDEAQIAAGYVLTCVCYPRSDVQVETDKQSEVA
mmetsp:Transcript_11571/g.24379  ORF Transcript_11571/g.24379 Transcript_11571/m.24379 type:complete len:403 (-) Transcript_11571:64-1272(-)